MNAAGSQTLTDRLSRVEAALGLSQLPSRYAMALDARDIDTLVGLFVDDVKAGPEGRAGMRYGVGTTSSAGPRMSNCARPCRSDCSHGVASGSEGIRHYPGACQQARE